MSKNRHHHKHGHKHNRHKHHSHDIEHHIDKEFEFDIIAKNLWKGKHGRIQLVRRRSDNKVLVWKRPRSLSWIHINSFGLEIKKSKIWRQIGVSNIRIRWHSDRVSLLKTYIEGCCLKDMLKNNPEFFSKDSKPLRELEEFVRKLIKSNIFIGDLNRANIIFDQNKEKWQLIDSSTTYPKGIFPNIKKKYEIYFLKSWSKSLNSAKEIRALKKFLKEC